MSVDFGVLPPEITSALMYAGPGSTSLTTAASAWNALAAELNSAALGYGSVVTQLASEEWLGPASASMAAAAQPYVEWMTNTSIAAEHAATLAQAAAGAFEVAFASVVPPPLIAANRAELAAAVQANVFGQYNSLIAQLESQYGEFWAQDSSAMYSYASQSATAAQVTPFTVAPAVANPAAAATQAASTAATAPNSIIGQLQLFLNQTIAQLKVFTNPFLASKGATINSALKEIWFLLTGVTVLPSNLGALLTPYNIYSAFFYNTEGLPYFSVGMGNFGVQIAKSAGALGGAAPAAASIPNSTPALGGALGGGAHTAGSVSVSGSVGTAGSVGKLSVPAAWSGATVPASHAASAVPVSTVSAAPEAAGSPGNLLGGMPLAGAGAGGHGTGPRYGFRPTVMARPPAAG
jgi:PPE-repeat protein